MVTLHMPELFIILVLALLIFGLVRFIIWAIGPRSSGTTWSSPWDTDYQRQQRFPSQRQQPYYQPSEHPGQEQRPQPYEQGYNPEQPYYQPSPQAGSQSYGQNYRSGESSQRPAAQSNDLDQPQAQYPERMPPMQQ
ncbi:MAG: hypothetical protein ACJ8CB_34000 [Ktedonobacteraceae bacterium]